MNDTTISTEQAAEQPSEHSVVIYCPHHGASGAVSVGGAVPKSWMLWTVLALLFSIFVTLVMIAVRLEREWDQFRVQ